MKDKLPERRRQIGDDVFQFQEEEEARLKVDKGLDKHDMHANPDRRSYATDTYGCGWGPLLRRPQTRRLHFSSSS